MGEQGDVSSFQVQTLKNSENLRSPSAQNAVSAAENASNEPPSRSGFFFGHKPSAFLGSEFGKLFHLRKSSEAVMSATAGRCQTTTETKPTQQRQRQRSNSEPQTAVLALARFRLKDGKKTNSAMKTTSLGTNNRTTTSTPMEGKTSRFAALGRLFKPWKWKRKKKSDKFEQTSRSLERKISMRATKEELIQRGVLMPEKDKDGIINLQRGDSGKQNHTPHHHANGSVRTDDRLHPRSSESIPSLGLSSVTYSLSVTSSEDDISKLNQMGTPPVIVDISSISLPDLEDVTSTDGEISAPCYQDHVPVSEIGPIPPPPMFSNPSPVVGPKFTVGPESKENKSAEEESFNKHQSNDSNAAHLHNLKQNMQNDLCHDSMIEEIPAKEPQLSAVPKKSALKKRNNPPHSSIQHSTSNSPAVFSSAPSHITQGVPVLPLSVHNKPIHVQTNSYSKNNSNEQLSRGFTNIKENAWFRIAKIPMTNNASYSPENKENRPLAYMTVNSSGDDSDEDSPQRWRDYYGRLAAKIARKDSLALKLAQRPDVQELIDKNIIPAQTEKEKQELREAIGNQLIRRLSLRPSAEELEQRNILKNQTPEEMKKEKENKKKMLIRKLSFRPTIEELKERKIIRFSDYVEVTPSEEYDRRADKPWTRLTPKDKAAIRKELNEFKSLEMHVHQESRHLTRFHRP